MVASAFHCALLLFVASADAVRWSYYQDEPGKIFLDYYSWMSELPGDIKLSALAIPGTRHSMATGDYLKYPTQALSLEDQLKAGIRVFHFGLRHVNEFAIYNDERYLNANFEKPLHIFNEFLEKNSEEVILLILEEKGLQTGCTRSVSDTFYWYRNEKPEGARIWDGKHIPTLGEVRGKIVIMDGMSGEHSRGIARKDIVERNEINLTQREKEYKLLLLIYRMLKKKGDSTLYVDWLGDFRMSSLKPWAEYVNEWVLRYLVHSNSEYPMDPNTPAFISYAFENHPADNNRIRIVMMDFPGTTIISDIFKLNSKPKGH